jgi:Reverse transcriptase (RNA-dependent DNA polymerase)
MGDRGHEGGPCSYSRDAFSTKDIGAVLEWLARKRWYSVADLKDGYWNVRLAEESRYLTAMKTVVGLVQYTRLTMGLKNAGCFFQCLVNNVYVGQKGAIMQAYLDDLAVRSDTPKQHVVDVRRVLERTRNANLRLKLAKCTFGKTKVELLGHKVRFGEVRPNDRHRDCLQRFEEPTNVTEQLRFLGLLQFFGAHVDHLAELVAPLHAVLEGAQWNKRKRKREIIRLVDWEKRGGGRRRKNRSRSCGMSSQTRCSWCQHAQTPRRDCALTRVSMGAALRCYNGRRKAGGYRWVLLQES